jgi:hypothetical protein
MICKTSPLLISPSSPCHGIPILDTTYNLPQTSPSHHHHHHHHSPRRHPRAAGQPNPNQRPRLAGSRSTRCRYQRRCAAGDGRCNPHSPPSWQGLRPDWFPRRPLLAAKDGGTAAFQARMLTGPGGWEDEISGSGLDLRPVGITDGRSGGKWTSQIGWVKIQGKGSVPGVRNAGSADGSFFSVFEMDPLLGPSRALEANLDHGHLRGSCTWQRALAASLAASQAAALGRDGNPFAVRRSRATFFSVDNNKRRGQTGMGPCVSLLADRGGSSRDPVVEFWRVDQTARVQV